MNWEVFVAKKLIEQDKQELMNCVCNKRGWVKWWLRFGNYRTKWIPCQMWENCEILNQGAALERPTFPVNTLLFRVPGPCLAAILDCRMIQRILRVLQETFLNDHLLKKNDPQQSSTIQRIGILFSRPDITGTRKRPESEMKRGPLNTSILSPHFPSGGGMLNHTGGTLSHSGMIDYSRFPISKFHLVKFPDSMKFQSWKINFETEVWSKTAYPHLTLHWIKEVEMAKSIDELMTSRSIAGRNDFPDFDMLDAMIASALKRLLDKHIHFRKRVSVEEQRAQKHDRFLRGRHIAYMISEYVRATGAHEAAQGLSTLFAINLQNDDVQYFDGRWDHALLSVSEMPSDIILEGLYKSKLQNSAQLQTVLALYDQETARNMDRQVMYDWERL